MAERHPMNPDASHIITIIVGLIGLLIVAACEAGCSDQVSTYDAYNDSVRGTCDATGGIPHTTLNRHGWSSDCSEALPE
jgi:hypothetical protein